MKTSANHQGKTTVTNIKQMQADYCVYCQRGDAGLIKDSWSFIAKKK